MVPNSTDVVYMNPLHRDPHEHRVARRRHNRPRRQLSASADPASPPSQRDISPLPLPPTTTPTESAAQPPPVSLQETHDQTETNAEPTAMDGEGQVSVSGPKEGGAAESPRPQMPHPANASSTTTVGVNGQAHPTSGASKAETPEVHWSSASPDGDMAMSQQPEDSQPSSNTPSMPSTNAAPAYYIKPAGDVGDFSPAQPPIFGAVQQSVYGGISTVSSSMATSAIDNGAPSQTGPQAAALPNFSAAQGTMVLRIADVPMSQATFSDLPGTVALTTSPVSSDEVSSTSSGSRLSNTLTASQHASTGLVLGIIVIVLALLCITAFVCRLRFRSGGLGSAGSGKEWRPDMTFAPKHVAISRPMLSKHTSFYGGTANAVDSVVAAPAPAGGRSHRSRTRLSEDEDFYSNYCADGGNSDYEGRASSVRARPSSAYCDQDYHSPAPSPVTPSAYWTPRMPEYSLPSPNLGHLENEEYEETVDAYYKNRKSEAGENVGLGLEYSRSMRSVTSKQSYVDDQLKDLYVGQY